MPSDASVRQYVIERREKHPSGAEHVSYFNPEYSITVEVLFGRDQNGKERWRAVDPSVPLPEGKQVRITDRGDRWVPWNPRIAMGPDRVSFVMNLVERDETEPGRFDYRVLDAEKVARVNGLFPTGADGHRTYVDAVSGAIKAGFYLGLSDYTTLAEREAAALAAGMEMQRQFDGDAATIYRLDDSQAPVEEVTFTLVPSQGGRELAKLDIGHGL